MKETIEMRDENRVCVRVWNRGGFGAGHVSLETFVGGAEEHGIYASFCSDLECLASGAGSASRPGSVRASRGVYTLKKDLTEEAPAADATFDLFSLNVAEINRVYLAFITSGCQWSLLEGITDRREFERICNDADLVFSLLIAGGECVDD